MVGAQALLVQEAAAPVGLGVGGASRSVSLSLIKHLASCNKTTRDKALRLLVNTWLPSQQQVLDDDDMKKVWKGLFYCVWHSDKALVQADLINRLSSLLLTLDLPLSIQYFSVFLLTMRREWPGIDALRLDKFYLLIRRFISSFFLLHKKNNWDLELTHRLMGILEENTFFFLPAPAAASDEDGSNSKVLLALGGNGNGVNYHVASVFLEELKPFLPVRAETLDILFKPFFSATGKSQDKLLVGKIKSNVFDVLLKMGKNLLQQKKEKKMMHNNVVDNDADATGDETMIFGTIALTMGFHAKFYDLGSSPDCFQGNRKVLFRLHEEFLKLDKDFKLSGIEISIPIVKLDLDDDADEVPKLIPVAISGTDVGASGMTMEAAEVALEGMSTSVTNSLKKNKKVKKASAKKPKMKKNEISLNNGNRDENLIIANGGNSSNGLTSDGNIIAFNESVISNLKMQFEKVAAEVGLDEEGANSCDSPNVTIKGTISKKRKRVRSINGQESHNPDLSGQGDAGGDTTRRTREKSAKKVRFSMKNNLVWKPQSPLPPQSLRLPPSVTPRGSALKKGIPPGPIREIPPATKKLKQKKKGRKGIKTISPAIKRLRKLQSLSI